MISLSLGVNIPSQFTFRLLRGDISKWLHLLLLYWQVVIDETILSSLETLQYHRNMNVQKIVCDLLHATSDVGGIFPA